MKCFHSFCGVYNIFTPFPVTEQLPCSFAAFLADQGLAPQTVKSYLSAVRNSQISLGLPDPRHQSSLPILKRVQAGIARLRMLKGSPPWVRLPITAHILARIQQALAASSDPDKYLVWAVAATAFFFFHLGELLPESAAHFNMATDLAWGDVAVDNHTKPSMIQVHLKKSKTNQFGPGMDIIMGTPLCPVSAILQYTAVRGTQPGPFFLNSNKVALSKHQFVTRIRAILQPLGLPQFDYAGHSFRIGAAMTAATVGVEDSMIQTLGRWQSAAFLQYIRTPKEQLAALSTVLANSVPQTVSPSGP